MRLRGHNGGLSWAMERVCRRGGTANSGTGIRSGAGIYSTGDRVPFRRIWSGRKNARSKEKSKSPPLHNPQGGGIRTLSKFNWEVYALADFTAELRISSTISSMTFATSEFLT